MTKIDWCINPDGTQGDTWNPVFGCQNQCSYCYARKIALRFNMDFDETKINWKAWDDGISKYIKSRKAKTIFVGSMTDVFGNWFWVDGKEEIDSKTLLNKVVSLCKTINDTRTDLGKEEHIFIFLTKNPKGYLELEKQAITYQMYFGVTLEHFQDKKADDMMEVIWKFGLNAFVSFEPILEYNKPSQNTKELVRNCSFFIMGYKTNNGKVIQPPDENKFWDISKELMELNESIFLKESIFYAKHPLSKVNLLKGRNLPWLKLV